ncbi:hypothetical protein Dimus_014704 [Dionaea muscipula]
MLCAGNRGIGGYANANAMVVILLLVVVSTLLQGWVFSGTDPCAWAGAVRIFPPENRRAMVEGVSSAAAAAAASASASASIDNVKDAGNQRSSSKEDLYRRLFVNGGNHQPNQFNFKKSRGAGGGFSSNGFEDSKRRIPSCPDALHN